MTRPTAVLFCMLALGLMTSPALAEPPEPGSPLPAGGTELLSPGDVAGLSRVGLDERQVRAVDVQGQPFDRAIEAQVEGAGEVPYAIQLTTRIDEPIRRGDVLHLRFYARNVNSMTGSANLGVVHELNRAPHTKNVDVPITVGSEWEVVDVPFTARQDHEAGGSQLAIRLGYARQTVQIGGLRLVNYGDAVRYDQLPRRRITYAGREPDAAWRTAANERIDQLRKADLTVVVKDAAGNVVPDAQVTAELARHAFGFGTAVSMRLLSDDADGERYRQTLKELFSTAVLENELKWTNIAQHEYERSDALVAWLDENEIPTRGHCLIWPGEQFLPRHIVEMLDEPEALRTTIEQHITTTAARYSGKLIDWDVINEPFANHAVMDVLGNEAMVEWFELAHAADPHAKLYLNDYAILATSNLLDTPHQRHFYETIKYLKDNGAPIHGIGMQGHFGGNITAPENLLKILDRYAELGLRIKVTELDINLEDEQLRADYMRDFHIVLFSHPAVDGILQWGFWEGSHWIPQAALFDRNWNLRPHGQAFIGLVHGEWKTVTEGQTDDAGRYQFRGFQGEYDVTITANGKAQAAKATLEAGGSEVVVTLE